VSFTVGDYYNPFRDLEALLGWLRRNAKSVERIAEDEYQLILEEPSPNQGFIAYSDFKSYVDLPLMPLKGKGIVYLRVEEVSRGG